MADFKPCSKRTPGAKTLLTLLLGPSMFGIMLGVYAGEKTQPQPSSTPPAPLAAEKKDSVPPTAIGPKKEVAPPAVLPPPPGFGKSGKGVGFSQKVRTIISGPGPGQRPFHFTFRPDTPLEELLPIPPKARLQASPLFIDDLSQVPEVAFQEPMGKTPDALRHTAHTMAKINHLNRQKADGFMVALLGGRPDLAGLPMAMGDDCRMKGERSQYFSQALALIKRAKGEAGTVADLRRDLQRVRMEEALIKQQAMLERNAVKTAEKPTPQPVPPPSAPNTGPRPSAAEPTIVTKVIEDGVNFEQLVEFSAVGRVSVARTIDPDVFWEHFQRLAAEEDKANAKLDRSQLEQVTLARIAALMQIMAPESVAMRKGLVKYLAGTSHAEATRALAKLAVFASEDEVRNPAIDALKVRREKDYTEVLLRGLRYPLPAVAKRATDAMVKLERADLVTELVNFLDEPDPRAPAIKEMGQKKVPVVRELVRINHHRNCVLCHAPAVPNEVSSQVSTAEVPRPDQPLPSPSEGYDNSIPDILVRLDVTYLRQDFSLMQPVADAHPWPDMQRFDYLVRTRVLTEKEAAAVPAPKTGGLSPYQRAALAALRELTGRDTAPTPDAWRRLLELPTRPAAEALE